jgi:phage gp29-like protein
LTLATACYSAARRSCLSRFPNNTSEADKAALPDALERMVSDAAAVAPEGCEITIESLANKSGVSNIHSQYIDTANAEMSEAVLGQTLATEIGGKGSYAAAAAHNLVRGGLAQAGRRRMRGV